MIGSSLIVGMMIYVLILGAVGFLTCLAIGIELMNIIRFLFGRRVFFVVLFLVGTWFMKGGTWLNQLEYRSVETFMSSWKIASTEKPDSEAECDMWGEMDFVRGQVPGYLPHDPYFISKNSLSSYTQIKKLGSDKIYLEKDILVGYESGIHKVKVFGTTANLYGHHGVRHNVPLKFWVASENNEIVKMELNGSY